MKKVSAVATIISLYTILIFSKGFAQGIGINSTGTAPHPTAILHVDAGTNISKGLLVTGTYNSSSTVPSLGSSSRLIFYPGKAAFRAGNVTGTQWDNTNVGGNSTAMGYNTLSSGFASTAIGQSTNAIGGISTAIGYGTTANGDYSTAMGSGTTASGNTSTAMGGGTTASGNTSTAIGSLTTASGEYSTAMGYGTIASGIVSTAIGSQTNASGHLSTAMGTTVSTNNQYGAFIIGDSDPNREGGTLSGFPDQFVARFWNGYYLMTSGNITRFGVQIGHNGNAWVSICDKNRKENFEPLNGEEVLQKISKIKFSSWNYKQQDPKIYRHYGITAQDFYNAFGKDKYGTIGNDTTVNPVDMIGIDMAAIQALEKRTTMLMAENERQNAESEKLKKQNAILNKKLDGVAEVKKENEELKKTVAQLQQKFDDQQKLLAQTIREVKVLALKQNAASESFAVK